MSKSLIETNIALLCKSLNIELLSYEVGGWVTAMWSNLVAC